MDVIYSIGSKFAGGGIGNVAYYAVRGIYRHGYLKRLICTSYSKTEIDPRKISTIPFVEKIPKYVIKDNLYDFFASFRIEKSDLFYGWNNHSLFSMRKAKRYGTKTVIDRGSVEATLQNKILSDEYRKIGLNINPMNRWNIKKMSKEYQETDYIVVPSIFVLKSFIDADYDENKLFLNHLGVDTEKFKPLFERNDAIFRLIFVGSVGIRKGVHHLLKAWNELKLKNAELVLVGHICPEISDILQHYMQRNVMKNIITKEFTEDVVEEYNNSSLFAFPSVEDGFGLVVTEAMGCGLPVIVSENVGAKDVVRNGKDGFIIETCNERQLKEKIKYFYDTPTELKRMGKNAREQAKKYTWGRYGSTLIKKLEEVYSG